MEHFLDLYQLLVFFVCRILSAFSNKPQKVNLFSSRCASLPHPPVPFSFFSLPWVWCPSQDSLIDTFWVEYRQMVPQFHPTDIFWYPANGPFSFLHSASQQKCGGSSFSQQLKMLCHIKLCKKQTFSVMLFSLWSLNSDAKDCNLTFYCLDVWMQLRVSRAGANGNHDGGSARTICRSFIQCGGGPWWASRAFLQCMLPSPLPKHASFLSM